MLVAEFIAAQIWYGVSGGAPTFILPFLNIFYSETLQLTTAQIGLLAAVRPWISAPAGSIIAGLADSWQRHALVLALCYMLATLSQGAMALVSTFGSQLALTLVASIVWAPPQIISDACVMAAASTPGDYGRIRSLASLAWALMAPVAGTVNGRWGVRVGIAAYTALALSALPAALKLPLKALKGMPAMDRNLEAVAAAAAAAPALPGAPAELGFAVAPLSAKTEEVEAPRPSALASALAIVRYIEAITEAGLVAPAPGMYGFSEISGPYMERHLAPPELVREATTAPLTTVETLPPAQREPTLPPIQEVPSFAALPSLSSAPSTGEAGMSQSVPASSFMPRPTSLPRPISLGNLRKAGRDAARMQTPLSEGSEGDDEGSAGSSAGDEISDADVSTARSPGSRGAGHSMFVWNPDDDDVALPSPLFALSRVTSDAEQLGPLGSHQGSVSEPRPAAAASQLLGVPEAAVGMTPRQHPIRTTSGGASESEPPTPGPGIRSAAYGRLRAMFAGSQTEDEATAAEQSPAVTPSGLGITPLQRYIEYRKERMRRGDGQRGAGMLGSKQPLPTASLPGSLAAAQAAITPAVWAEAIRVEGEGTPGGTGSYIVNMLESKLRRLARTERARRREAARAARAARAAQTAGLVQADGTAEVPTSADTTDGAAHVPASQGSDDALVKPTPLESGPGSAVITSTPQPPPPPPSMTLLFRDPEVVIFFALTTLMGVGHGIIGAYLFMYIKSLGGSEALMGGVLMANALPELPVFFFFGGIAARCTMTALLFVACGCLALRLMLFPLLPVMGVAWVLAVETLHGITFALGWSACAMNSSKIAPPGLESTTQALFQGLWTGVGTGLGGLAGGVAYHHLGPGATFAAAGMGMAVATTLCALWTAWNRRRQARARRVGSEPVFTDLEQPLLLH